MSKLKARLKRLEDALVGATSCLGCAARRITLHQEYELPDGETVTLPPFPKLPPCSCRNPVMKIVFRHPGQVSSREEAERLYAEYAKFHRAWRPDDSESD